MQVKIYHLTSETNYSNWVPNRVLVNSIEEADLVWAEGGADISTWIYGEPQGPRTHTDPERDKRELKLLRKAVELGKHLFGTCRGSQLLCALAGGSIVQDQDNPDYLHPIYTSDGRKINMTSTHHEAMNPYVLPEDEYKLLAWTTDQSKYHLNGEDKEIYLNGEKEAEICYFPKIKALCVQGHPENLWNAKEQFADTFEYLHDLLNKHLTNQL